ncbi:MAG: TorF family putative porin [Pseudomonadota bacterium]
MRHGRIVLAAALALGGHSVGAPAAGLDPALSVTATTDERRRGLGWSDGRPSVTARGTISPIEGTSLTASATSLRRSARHDEAAWLVDATLGYRHSLGSVDFDGQLTYHAFPGRSALDYVELGGGAATLVGPVQLEGFALYAPKQQAIGGDNLYLAGAASMAIIGTPFSLRAQVGRSSGSTDDPVRAQRLRPRGRYWDASLRLDHVQGPLRLSIGYTDSFGFARPALPGPLGRNMGARVLVSAGFDLGG